MNNYYNTPNMGDLIMSKMYGYFVKYDRLAFLINATFRNSDADVLDIFIDCNDIFNHIVVPDENSFINQKNKLYISSGIINMCAHYRNFFKRYYSTHTRFWLLYSHQAIFHSQRFEQYKRKDVGVTRTLAENLVVLESLCPYLPDIMWCDTSDGFENTLTMKQILDFERSFNGLDNPAIMITKDPYNYMIPAEIPNTFILRPKKSKGEDLSYIASFDSCIPMYIADVYKKTPEPMQFISIDPDKLSLLMAIGKVPSRNLKSICRLDTVLKVLSSCGFSHHIYDIETYLDQLQLPPKINKFEVSCRYHALDILYNALAYNEISRKFNYTGMVDLYDPETVKRINETYFRDIPLDLEVL